MTFKKSINTYLLGLFLLPLFPLWDLIGRGILLGYAIYTNKNLKMRVGFSLLGALCLVAILIGSTNLKTLLTIFSTFSPYGWIHYDAPTQYMLLLFDVLYLVYIYKKNRNYIDKNFFYTIFSYFIFMNSVSIIHGALAHQLHINLFIMLAISFLVINKNKFFNNLSYIVKISGFWLSCLVLVQKIIGDYSYVVRTISKVRASYFYHSSLSLFLIYSLILWLGSTKESTNLTRVIKNISIILTILLALYINGSRSLFIVIPALLLLSFWLHYKKLWLRIFLSAISLFLVGFSINSHFFYTKNFTIKAADTLAVNSENQPTSLQNIYKDNAYRKGLAKRAIFSISNNLLIGTGLGNQPVNLEILRDGKVVIVSDYSSHSFIIDLALTHGVFNLIFIVFIAIYSFRKTYSKKLTKSDRNTFLIVGMFTIYQCMFFPLEQNYTLLIPLILLLSPILLSSVNAEGELEEKRSLYTPLKYLLYVGTLVVCFVFSPTYFLPALQLSFPSALYLESNKDRITPEEAAEGEIYTTSPSTKIVYQWILDFTHPNKYTVHVLPDDYEAFLKLSSGFLFWDSSILKRYPNITKNLKSINKAPNGFFYNHKLPKHYVKKRLYLTPISLFKLKTSKKLRPKGQKS